LDDNLYKLINDTKYQKQDQEKRLKLFEEYDELLIGITVTDKKKEKNMLHITQTNSNSTAIKLEGTINVAIIEGDLHSLKERLLDQIYYQFNLAEKDFNKNNINSK
jgi:hypothetical protein